VSILPPQARPDRLTNATRARPKGIQVPSLDGRELAAIFLGGAVGAVVRVWLGRTFTGGAPDWPWVTFTINITGSFALAYFATRLQERLPQSTYRRPLLSTGFCGAYTTFSTMQVEILKMLEDDRYALAAGYAAASIAAGYLAIWIGTALVRRTRVIA
jgi:fluoride exporter